MSGSAVIFLGPTLQSEEARPILNAIYLPPAAQGDLYRAYQDHSPAIVGLIDGYFECVPSVWHKEILFLMAEGVHVLGSSSMGALRAAELDVFGMTGLGEIYAAYKTGAIEDDDEVAVLHGPAELGFPSLSEAMVNIRKTLADAVQQNVIPLADHDRILCAMKEISYKQRTYSALLNIASASTTAPRLENLKSWLETGRRNLKKEDALRLLDRIRTMQESCIAAKKVQYKFEYTSMWASFVKSLKVPEKIETSELH